MTPRQNEKSTLVALVVLLLYLATWVLGHWRVFFDPSLLLPEDNFKTHFNLFSYVYWSLEHFRIFPSWVYTPEGGMALAPLSNNYLLLMPYRWIGYFLGWTTEIPANLAYKFSFLIVGQGIFLLGGYLLIAKVFSSRLMGILAVGLSLVTSITVPLLHQEQVLGTTFFIPFLWFFLLKAKENYFYWPLVGAVLGLSLNSHYPHLPFVYWGLVLVGVLLFHKSSVKEALSLSKKKLSFFLVSTFCFLTAASPVFYSYLEYRKQLTSPFRQQKESLESTDYASYLEVNQQQASSVIPFNFILYVNPWLATENMAPLDRYTFFLTPFLILLLLGAAIKNFQASKLHLFLVLGLSLMAIGIYGPFPRILWQVFPFFRLFRQWFHFVPLLNLHLLFLVILFLNYLRNRKEVVVFSSATLLVFFSSVPWAWSCWKDYDKYYVRSKGPLENDGGARFIYRSFWENNSLFEPVFVSFKGSHFAEISARTKGARWLVDDGNQGFFVLPGVETFTQPRGNGFELRMSKWIAPTVFLNFMQWDDGKWKIRYDGGEIKTHPGQFGNLRFAIPGNLTQLEITRDGGSWFFFLLLMAVSPLIATCLIVCRRKTK